MISDKLPTPTTVTTQEVSDFNVPSKPDSIAASGPAGATENSGYGTIVRRAFRAPTISEHPAAVRYFTKSAKCTDADQATDPFASDPLLPHAYYSALNAEEAEDGCQQVCCCCEVYACCLFL